MGDTARALLELADRVDGGMKFHTFWSHLHVICSPDDAGDGYAERLGQVFDALRAVTGVSYQQYLSAVLRRRQRDGQLADVIREAARRLP